MNPINNNAQGDNQNRLRGFIADDNEVEVSNYLAVGFNLEDRCPGSLMETFLTLAIYHSRFAIAHRLIEAGADVNSGSTYSDSWACLSPLQLALVANCKHLGSPNVPDTPFASEYEKYVNSETERLIKSSL